MSSPSSRISPSVGCSKPAIMRSVVVLPQPDGPSIEKNSPAGISRSMPSTAVNSPNFLTRLISLTSPPATERLLSRLGGTKVPAWGSHVECGEVPHRGLARAALAAGEDAPDQESGDDGGQR